MNPYQNTLKELEYPYECLTGHVHSFLVSKGGEYPDNLDWIDKDQPFFEIPTITQVYFPRDTLLKVMSYCNRLLECMPLSNDLSLIVSNSIRECQSLNYQPDIALYLLRKLFGNYTMCFFS